MPTFPSPILKTQNYPLDKICHIPTPLVIPIIHIIISYFNDEIQIFKERAATYEQKYNLNP